ncbi:hypothetical protein ABPG75_007724 [Micractinium tetrahymenae]
MEPAHDGHFLLPAWYGEQPIEQLAEQALHSQQAGPHMLPPPPLANMAAGPVAPLRVPGGLGPSSARYRGVSRDKGCRYEAHVWARRKQIFLGCYHSEELAARAYDLASIALRGTAARTNFPAQQYAAELAVPPQQIESLALALREQAKALGRPPSPAPALQPWELPLSEAVSGQPSLGLFASEAEAARAVDRALLARDGLAAAPHLNFPLGGYAYLLDPREVEEAVRLGLMPAPAPLFPPAPALDHTQVSPFAGAAAMSACQAQEAHLAESMAPPAPFPLPRRASITPRHAGQPVLTPFSG